MGLAPITVTVTKLIIMAVDMNICRQSRNDKAKNSNEWSGRRSSREHRQTEEGWRLLEVVLNDNSIKDNESVHRN
jgi:hypothetical protein